MLKSGKLTPNLDEKTTKSLNLTVLQRTDPSVEEILMTAAHVAMYELNTEATQWSRKDVEGSLFVVKRNGQPRFQFIVLNRLSTDNMVENLLGDFEYEVQGPYLLYRNASQEIYGIWFYNSDECEETGNLFGRILNTYPKASAKPMVSPMTSKVEDIEAILARAVIDDPASSDAAGTTDDHSDSVMKFFNNALNGASTPNAAITGQPYHSSATVVPAYPQLVAPTTLQSVQIPSGLSTSTPILSILEKPESNTSTKHPTDLVTPSSLFSPRILTSTLIMHPMTSSVPTAPPLNNSQGNAQPPYGASLLQPFPPPTPRQSLTPTSAPAPSYMPVISREKVREALHSLVQDSQFIDMVYQAMVNAHHS